MDLFSFTADEKEGALRANGIAGERALERDVRILEEWLAKQPHLPQKLPYADFLEKFLVSEKGRVERVKQKIDAHFTLRGLNPHFFELFAAGKAIPPSKNVVEMVPLPRLTPEFARVFSYRMRSDDADLYHFDNYLQITTFNIEMMLRFDYNSGIVLVMDCANYNINHVKKIDIVQFHRHVTMIMDGYSSRIKGMHFIHMKPAVALVLNLVKSVLKAKIFQRIHYHENLESLHKLVPPHCLPKEYGGSCGTLDKIGAQVDALFERERSYLQGLERFASDEKLRIGKCKYATDGFGLEGTFKKLDLD